jgi:hypothetical protein
LTYRTSDFDYVLPPEQAAFPLHYHLGNEEMLVVIEGAPSLRTPDGERELKRGEVAEGLQPPTPEEIGPVRSRVEKAQGEGGQRRCFSTGGNESEAGASARHDERGDARPREGDMGREVPPEGGVEDRAAEVLRRRPDAPQPREIEKHRRRTGGLDPRRELACEVEKRRLGGKNAGSMDSSEHRALSTDGGELEGRGARGKSAGARLGAQGPQQAARAGLSRPARSGGMERQRRTAGAVGHVGVRHEDEGAGSVLDHALEADPRRPRQTPDLVERHARKVQDDPLEKPRAEKGGHGRYSRG